MAEDMFENYWSLRMEGATARLNAALDLISHPGTRGSLGENVLRSILVEYLPRRWDVGTGFLMNAEKQASLQVDVLVFDTMASLPLYRDGDLAVLTAGAATAAVEVKARLDREKLYGALDNIASVKAMDPNISGTIFAYLGQSTETTSSHLRSYLKRTA